jgi:hypothetical protein
MLALAAAVGGCAPAESPPPATAPAAPPAAPAPPSLPPMPSMTGGAAPSQGTPVDVQSLEVDATRPAELLVKAPHRSLAVVERYETALKKLGWRPRAPRAPNEPGQRKWFSTGAPVGPTDAYDAAWEDPQGSRVAVLSVWHMGGEQDVQHATFEFRAPSAL